MKEYAKENWELFNKYYPELSKKIQEEEQVETVWTEDINNGEKVIALTRGNRAWYLNSRLDPDGAAQIYSDRYKSRIYLCYFIFGFGDGKHIRKLLEKCDETNQVIVFEPSMEIFIEAMNNFALKDILMDTRIAVCFVRQSTDLKDFILSKITYSHLDLIEYCILPGYDVLFPELCSQVIDGIIAASVTIRSNDATIRVFKREFPQNMLFNMKNMIKGCNCVQIKEKLKRLDLSGIPAIIVSAGPSLDKNVMELKKAQGKSLIIVVDSALKTVIRAGIRPDIVISIDARVPDKFFEGIELEGMNWICMNQTKPWILKNFKGKVFYCGGFNEKWDKIVEEELGYTIDPIRDEGGSVSTTSFAIAKYFGFKTIILVGQDLAFTDGRSHTSEIVNAIGDNDKYIENRSQVIVEGIHGEELVTDMQMMLYKKWFEKQIEDNKGEVLVIDATEGGARIYGAEEETLSDAVKKYCLMEVDLFDCIDMIEPPLDEEKRGRLNKKIISMKGEMLKLKEKLSKTIRQIQKMRDEFALSMGDIKNKKEILLRLKSINEEYEKEEMLEWLQFYAAEEEYELFENIYKDEDMSEEELINKSQRLYEAYYQKTDLFIEDYEAYAV